MAATEGCMYEDGQEIKWYCWGSNPQWNMVVGVEQHSILQRPATPSGLRRQQDHEPTHPKALQEQRADQRVNNWLNIYVEPSGTPWRVCDVIKPNTKKFCNLWTFSVSWLVVSDFWTPLYQIVEYKTSTLDEKQAGSRICLDFSKSVTPHLQ